MTESHDISFEEAMKRLEEIVKRLEGPDLGLDDSLALFQEGVGLARVCSKRLDDAEHRIEQLLGGPGGSAEKPVVVPVGAEQK